MILQRTLEPFLPNFHMIVLNKKKTAYSGFLFQTTLRSNHLNHGANDENRYEEAK